MSIATLPRITAEEFVVWAMAQPGRTRHELFNGKIVSMAPERVSHVRGKQRVYQLLANAIAAAGLQCEAFVDGVGAQVDDQTIFEPDAMVRCGAPLSGDAIFTADPIIVVEVLSPPSKSRDTGEKLAGYFQLPLVRHYLIVAMDSQTVIHHERDEAGKILTHILRGDATARLDPPGIVLDGFFPLLEPT